MGLEALIMDDEDETNLGYHVQDRKDWVEYSYGFDGLDLILSKDGKVQDLNLRIYFTQKKRMKDFMNGDMPKILVPDMMG